MNVLVTVTIVIMQEWSIPTVPLQHCSFKNINEVFFLRYENFYHCAFYTFLVIQSMHHFSWIVVSSDGIKWGFKYALRILLLTLSLNQFHVYFLDVLIVLWHLCSPSVNIRGYKFINSLALFDFIMQKVTQLSLTNECLLRGIAGINQQK